MTYDQAIETLCAFLREHVAGDILLKKADDDGDGGVDGVAQAAELVHPVVCPVFSPALATNTDFMPESGTQTAPALIVTAQPAENDGTRRNPTRQLMRVMAVVWDDGVIAPEPMEDGEGDALRKRVDVRQAYRAAVNLCERVTRALEAHPAMDGGLYVRGPFRMGLYSEREGSPDYYPYCVGWVECTAEYMRSVALDSDIMRMVE